MLGPPWTRCSQTWVLDELMRTTQNLNEKTTWIQPCLPHFFSAMSPPRFLEYPGVAPPPEPRLSKVKTLPGSHFWVEPSRVVYKKYIYIYMYIICLTKLSLYKDMYVRICWHRCRAIVPTKSFNPPGFGRCFPFTGYPAFSGSSARPALQS